MISVSFFIKNSKKDKHGKVPINAKIYRSEDDKSTIYTKIRVNPVDWDGFQVLETDMFHSSYNAILSAIKSDLLLQCANHQNESTGTIKQYYLDSFKIKYNIGDLVNEYFQFRFSDSAMKNKDTIRTYRTHHKAISDYLRITNLYNHEASTFAYQQGRIFYQKILNDAKSIIYSNKLFRKIKAAVEWGVGERLIDNNSINGFKLKTVKKKRLTSNDYLTVDEIARIISLEMPAKYNFAKILCTRQIFTGMAFVDAVNFQENTISIVGNQKHIIAKRSKTGEEFIVPLNSIAQAVCEGYEWKGRKITNGTYNEQLKVLAGYAGIKKNVTTHMLRRTFAQSMLDGGMSEEVVAKMLGHVDTRMIKFYAVISESRITSEYNERMAA